MGYAAAAILLGWCFFSWKIGVGLAVMCGVIAIFYAGALKGEAQAKVVKAFSITVFVVSALMIGAVTQGVIDPEQPKMCGNVAC